MVTARVLITVMGLLFCLGTSQAGQTTTNAWGAPYAPPSADLNTAVVVEQAQNGIFKTSGLGVSGSVNQYNGPVSNATTTNIGNLTSVTATAQNGTVTVGAIQDSSHSTQTGTSTSVAIKGQSFDAANIAGQ